MFEIRIDSTIIKLYIFCLDKTALRYWHVIPSARTRRDFRSRSDRFDENQDWVGQDYRGGEASDGGTPLSKEL